MTAPAASQVSELRQASTAKAAEISSFAPGSGVERRYSMKFLQSIDQRMKLAGVPPELASALSRRFAAMSRSELDRDGRVVDNILASAHPQAGLEAYESQAKLSSVVTPGGFRVAPNAEKSWTVTPPKGEPFVFGAKGEKSKTLGDGTKLSLGKGGKLTVGDQELVRSTAENAARLGSGLGALTVSIAAGAAGGSVFAVMVEYQKMMGKEARADRHDGGTVQSGKLTFGALVQSALPWPFHKDLAAPAMAGGQQSQAELQKLQNVDLPRSEAKDRDDARRATDTTKPGPQLTSGSTSAREFDAQAARGAQQGQRDLGRQLEDQQKALKPASETLATAGEDRLDRKDPADQSAVAQLTTAGLQLVTGSPHAKELGALLARAGQSGAPSSRNDPDAERAALLIAIGSRAAKLESPKTAPAAMRELTDLAGRLRGVARSDATASIQQSLGGSTVTSALGMQAGAGASSQLGAIGSDMAGSQSRRGSPATFDDSLNSRLASASGPTSSGAQTVGGAVAESATAGAAGRPGAAGTVSAAEVAALQQQLSALGEALKQLTETRKALQGQLQTLQDQLKERKAELAALQSDSEPSDDQMKRIDALNNEIAALEGQIARTQGSTAAIETQMANVIRDIEDVKAKLEEAMRAAQSSATGSTRPVGTGQVGRPDATDTAHAATTSNVQMRATSGLGIEGGDGSDD